MNIKEKSQFKISGKPKSILQIDEKEEMKKYQNRKSDWQEDNPNLKRFHLVERVGFDKTTLKVMMIKVDENVFSQKLKDIEADDSAEIKISVDLAGESSEAVLASFFTKNMFKKITIELSPYEELNIYKKRRPTGVYDDIVQFKIRVRPPALHPELGNYQNYAYEDLYWIIQRCKKQLRGIGIEIDALKLYHFELNRTFEIYCPISDLIPKLEFLCFQKKGKYTSHESNNFDDKSIEKEPYNFRLINADQTFRFKVYDKNVEMMQNKAHNFFRLTFQPNKYICRVEFTASKKKEVWQKFRHVLFDKKSEEYKKQTWIDINDLSQDKIEKAFEKMFVQHFCDAYECYFKWAEKEIIREIKRVKALKGNWLDELCNRLIAVDGNKKFHRVVGCHDLDEYICENSLFDAKRKYYKERIAKKILSRSSFYSDEYYFHLYVFFEKGLKADRSSVSEVRYVKRKG